MMRVLELLGWPVTLGMQQRKKEKIRKKKKGGCFMPLAVQCWWSLCVLKRVVGHVSKLWEGHGWVMHAIWVQAAIVVVKTLRQHGHFGFWPSESGGM